MYCTLVGKVFQSCFGSFFLYTARGFAHENTKSTNKKRSIVEERFLFVRREFLGKDARVLRQVFQLRFG